MTCLFALNLMNNNSLMFFLSKMSHIIKCDNIDFVIANFEKKLMRDRGCETEEPHLVKQIRESTEHTWSVVRTCLLSVSHLYKYM